jgi:hypothetical protein
MTPLELFADIIFWVYATWMLKRYCVGLWRVSMMVTQLPFKLSWLLWLTGWHIRNRAHHEHLRHARTLSIRTTQKRVLID